MTKRIISVLLCSVVAVLMLATSAAAMTSHNYLDKAVADIKLYADEQALLGSEFTVTVYIENIVTADGVLSNDLPLFYDKDRISISNVECIFPEAWGDSGEYLGMAVPTDYPHYLRSVPDASVEMLTNPAYRITESKQIGYKVTFKANKLGEAFVAIENNPDYDECIMLVVVEKDGEEINNYGANGMRITVDIVNKLDDNSSAGSNSTDVSKDTAHEQSKAESDDSQASVTSVESTGEGELLSNESDGDASADTSGDSAGNGKDDDPTDYTWLIIVAVVTVIAAGAAIAVVLVNKKKQN